jgi:phosphoglucosamine mutase
VTLKFGTDGVRGRAYAELTLADVERLAVVAGEALGGDAMIVGTDTRESGPDFVAAIARGLGRNGIETWSMGDTPTPAVARGAATHGIAGVMVSASHNPYHDNGIKFFAPGGRKLTDVQQELFEFRLGELGDLAPVPNVDVIDRPALLTEYIDSVVSSIDGRSLDGLRIGVDCANGSASGVAPDVLAGLGAELVTIHGQPNGRNINDHSGSTDMKRLQALVADGNSEIGIAFDGDADRVLGVDADGGFIDGDQLIGICAIDRHRRSLLTGATVAVTVMTNLGFHQGMDRQGIHVHQTLVGDRHVLRALEDNAWSLGGEQSGHVIFADFATTGDGLLTAVQLLDTVARSGRTLADLADEAMTRLPQRLRNVEVSGSASDAMEWLSNDIARVAETLGDTGRLLVRPSGTEPLIRVMAEAPTQADADRAVDDLVTVLHRRS